jgi:hypothetical protein
MADKRIVHLYWRGPKDKPFKMHAYMSDAVHLVKTRPNEFSVDGKFVGEPPPPPPEHVTRAMIKATSRMRPWYYP